MPKVNVNGLEMYYETQGEGMPLVLIAGLGYPLWEWHKMVPLLAKHFRVITFDNRGVGQTDKPDGPYTAWMLASDVAGLLDALKIEQAVIMGHSMGGFVAQAFALEYPQRVSKLILCSTNFGGPHHVPVEPEAMKVLVDVSGDVVTRFKNGLMVSTAPGFAQAHPAVIDEWLAWRLANPVDAVGYRAQLAIGLGLLSEEASFERKLHQIDVPVFIMTGSEDRVVPPANAALLAGQIRGSEVCVLSGAGHFFPIEQAQEAVQAVIHFAL